jgi:predicted transcriptional regulator
VEIDRITVTMNADMAAAVRTAAERTGSSVSAWVGQAVADRIRNELLRVALDEWEAEFGALTEAELDAAAARLGIARRSHEGAA